MKIRWHFLLPKNQSNYIFSYGGEVNLDGRESIVVSVSEKPVSEPLTIVEKDDCLFLSRPSANQRQNLG
jgi:hypothetical protein